MQRKSEIAIWWLLSKHSDTGRTSPEGTTMAIIENTMPFTIGSTEGLSDTQKQILVREFQRSPEASQSRLSGRMRPHIAELEEFGRVVIKHYFRGGILRHVNRRTYLKTGNTRSRAEFDFLNQVRKMGINAPLPVAFASRTIGLAVYHAWLVTKEIPGAETLADLSRTAPERAETILPDVATQINMLVCRNILHVDLHPGNILIDEDGRVYVVDFDKAVFYPKTGARLAGHYLERWHRAVVKHELPLFLHEQIEKAVPHD